MAKSNGISPPPYQKGLAACKSVAIERVIHQRLASLDRGEPGVPAKKVLTDIRQRLGVERK